VWRHPNLGIAYVAQHAFHHVEEHMEMSPSQYICWRYETGEDKEEQNKVRASKPQYTCCFILIPFANSLVASAAELA
jgi:hypothetical protein